MVKRVHYDPSGDNDFSYQRVDSPDGPRREATVSQGPAETYYVRTHADSGMADIYRSSDKGTKRTKWNLKERWEDEVVDFDGTKYRYEHDAYGNLTLIETPKTLSLYTYYPPDLFDPPYINLRMRERIEDGVHKRYFYNVHGQLLRTDPPS